MKRMSKDRWVAVAMISPSLILLAVFVYGFIGQTFWISLTNWGARGAPPAMTKDVTISFVGFQNFKDLFTSLLESSFRQDLVNNLFFTLLFISACLGVGLGMAILLDQKVKGEGIFRTIFLFPMALSFVVTGTVWRWIFSPKYGINSLLGLDGNSVLWFSDKRAVTTFDWNSLMRLMVSAIIGFLMFIALSRNHSRRGTRILYAAAGIGLGIFYFLGDGYTNFETTIADKHSLNLAIVSIVLAATWQMSGYTMAIYLAGLRGIPDELREAARVDGCTEIQIYRHIILPLMQPITLSAAIILGHISLKIFDLVMVMGGGNNGYIDVPGVYLYYKAFRGNNFASGSAIAIIMLIMVAVIIVPYLIRTFGREAERSL